MTIRELENKWPGLGRLTRRERLYAFALSAWYEGLREEPPFIRCTPITRIIENRLAWIYNRQYDIAGVIAFPMAELPPIERGGVN